MTFPTTFPSSFAIIVGLGMITQWVMSFIKEQIPELRTEPIRIWFHIAAEMATAVMLIVGGVGLRTGWPPAPTVHVVSVGMLLYTAIVSPGYFAQRGRWIWAVVFAMLIMLAVVSLAMVTG